MPNRIPPRGLGERYYLKDLKRWSRIPDLKVRHITREKFNAEKPKFYEFCKSYIDREGYDHHIIDSRDKVVEFINKLERCEFEITWNQKKNDGVGVSVYERRQAQVNLCKVYYSYKFRCMYWHQVVIKHQDYTNENYFKFKYKSGIVYPKSHKIEFGWKMQPLDNDVPFPFGIFSTF